MKVRHTDHSKIATFDVLEESESYYIARYDGCFQATILLPKSQFEPIPDERWEDVSESCDLYVNQRAFSTWKTDSAWTGHDAVPDGYRLVKVTIGECPGEVISLPLTYFRVERRVP